LQRRRYACGFVFKILEDGFGVRKIPGKGFFPRPKSRFLNLDYTFMLPKPIFIRMQFREGEAVKETGFVRLWP